MEGFLNDLFKEQHPLLEDFVIFRQDGWSIARELTFWLRVLRDHMMMISQKLAPTETQLLQISNSLLEEGDELRRAALSTTIGQGSNATLGSLLQQSLDYGKRVKILKQTILNRQLNANIKIGLAPTVISHMINELEQFLFTAQTIADTGQLPPKFIGNHHDLWLSDITGHLDVIATDLDGVEKLLRKRVKKHEKAFDKLYMKLSEFTNYIKHGVVEFPAMVTLTRMSVDETIIYLALVLEIYRMSRDKLIVSKLDPEFLIHMIFEQIYYLHTMRLVQPGFDPLVKYPILPSQQTIETIAQLKQ